ncbi:hypothetical protein J4210_05880 [Candidatus Woesearchaeota archaeon]|nr:hypothetical protein [Candidatus Woesearchaeota archaeon]
MDPEKNIETILDRTELGPEQQEKKEDQYEEKQQPVQYKRPWLTELCDGYVVEVPPIPDYF